MQVKQFNATKWIVDVNGVGAIFVGREDQCHEFVQAQMCREQKFRYENLTEHKDFYSYQPAVKA